jgi:hypothetical protein
LEQSQYQKLTTDLESIKDRLNWLEKDHLQIKKDLEKLKLNNDSKDKLKTLPSTHTDFWVGD